MSWNREHTFTRDDGETEVEVEVVINSPGHSGNGWDDPGEGPEVEVPDRALLIVRGEGGKWETSDEVVELTEAEVERFEREFCEDGSNFDFLDDGPDDDR